MSAEAERQMWRMRLLFASEDCDRAIGALDQVVRARTVLEPAEVSFLEQTINQVVALRDRLTEQLFK